VHAHSIAPGGLQGGSARCRTTLGQSTTLWWRCCWWGRGCCERAGKAPAPQEPAPWQGRCWRPQSRPRRRGAGRAGRPPGAASRAVPGGSALWAPIKGPPGEPPAGAAAEQRSGAPTRSRGSTWGAEPAARGGRLDDPLLPLPAFHQSLGALSERGETVEPGVAGDEVGPWRALCARCLRASGDKKAFCRLWLRSTRPSLPARAAVPARPVSETPPRGGCFWLWFHALLTLASWLPPHARGLGVPVAQVSLSKWSPWNSTAVLDLSTTAALCGPSRAALGPLGGAWGEQGAGTSPRGRLCWLDPARAGVGASLGGPWHVLEEPGGKPGQWLHPCLALQPHLSVLLPSGFPLWPLSDHSRPSPSSNRHRATPGRGHLGTGGVLERGEQRQALNLSLGGRGGGCGGGWGGGPSRSSAPEARTPGPHWGAELGHLRESCGATGPSGSPGLGQGAQVSYLSSRPCRTTSEEGGLTPAAPGCSGLGLSLHVEYIHHRRARQSLLNSLKGWYCLIAQLLEGLVLSPSYISTAVVSCSTGLPSWRAISCFILHRYLAMKCCFTVDCCRLRSTTWLCRLQLRELGSHHEPRSAVPPLTPLLACGFCMRCTCRVYCRKLFLCLWIEALDVLAPRAQKCSTCS